MSMLVLVAGVPGVGKSAWARTFFGAQGAIVSSDAIRRKVAGSLRAAHEQHLDPWDEFFGQVGRFLRGGVDVVADATFLTATSRARARDVAECHSACCHLVLFADWRTAVWRNARRGRDERVPDEVMEDMIRCYCETEARVEQERYATITRIAAFG